MTTAIEPSADEIERVRNAIEEAARLAKPRYHPPGRIFMDMISRAAILAMDRRAEVVGEPAAYMHKNGAIWRLDNCPAGMDFSEPGWTALYPHASPPAPAVAPQLSGNPGELPAPAVAVPEDVEDLIERLLDAQQDINLAANEHMSQPLCDASALIDEVERVLRKLAAAPAPPATRSEAPFEPADMLEGREPWISTHERIGAAVAARSIAKMVIEWFAGPKPNDEDALSRLIERRLSRFSPPASRRLSNPVPRSALVDHLRSEFSNTYDCTRAWSAWEVGTMSVDDFEPVTDRVEQITDELLVLLSGFLPEADPAEVDAAGVRASIQVATWPAPAAVAWRYQHLFGDKPLPWQLTDAGWLAARERGKGARVEPLGVIDPAADRFTPAERAFWDASVDFMNRRVKVEDTLLAVAAGKRGPIEAAEAKELAVRLGVPTQPGQPVEVLYTNWRGVTGVRSIIPKSVWYGSTEWHPEPQWLLRAFDVEKQADRDFALIEFGGGKGT
ncbi:hypothetical protein [Kaistia sp. MMO-174]|uniref:hypothetical protein n=1 Tax=Kaistia sp. MMO-174 TaxID=3081256 RepID=UPI003015E419